jgi:hypothetical protein
VSAPDPTLRHLSRLTDYTGIFEHAIGALPRRDDGYCTDDAGRALAVACRSGEPVAERIAEVVLAFLIHAHAGGGRFRLRMGFDRRWTSDPLSDDANGRAIYGLGVAAAMARWPHVRRAARRLFEEAAAFRTTWPRAIAHAAIGASELLLMEPTCGPARALVDDATQALPRSVGDPAWPWPEPRLAYANALLAEGLLAAGSASEDPATVRDGLRLLTWLVDTETREHHLSFSPTGGWAPGEPRPAFDQQPIEAAAMADAAARAFDLTGDRTWLEPLRLSVGWFEGLNDVGVRMFDPATGGGFDGLHADGVNQNQGAESTIAFVSTMQQAERLLIGGRDAPEAQPEAISASSN